MTLQKTWDHVIAPTSHVSRLPGIPAPGNLTPYSGLHGTRHACVQSHRDTHTYTEVKIKSFSRPMYLNIVLKLIFDKNKTKKETKKKPNQSSPRDWILGSAKGKVRWWEGQQCRRRLLHTSAGWVDNSSKSWFEWQGQNQTCVL